jgi:hypothetical protein
MIEIANLHDLYQLQEKDGLPVSQIANFTGLDENYIIASIYLSCRKEFLLLAAVESGILKINQAVEISDTKKDDLRPMLQCWIDQKTINSGQMLAISQIIWLRNTEGKGSPPARGAAIKLMCYSGLVKASRDRHFECKKQITQYRLIEADLHSLNADLTLLRNDPEIQKILKRWHIQSFSN